MNKIIYSVIIPYKGRFNFVRQAIRSVNSQIEVNRENIQILAISDPDGERSTRNHLKKIYPKVTFLDYEDKEDSGGKRNTGLKYAKGEYIIFLDSDDQLKNNFISVMTSEIEKDKKAGAVMCLSDKIFDPGFSNNNRITRRILASIQDLGILLGYFFNSGYIVKSSFYLTQLSHMMYKRKIIGKMRFSYDYNKAGEDWDFNSRILRKTKIKIVPRRLIYFRYSPGSSTFEKIHLMNKWKSYRLLISRLPVNMKRGLFYRLLLIYIGRFDVSNKTINSEKE